MIAPSSHEPPRVPLAPFTRPELEAWFRGGEPEADVCERVLAWAARARGGLDLAIAEGLDALRQGDRLASLGCHLDDYAREVLDIGRSAADSLARLGRELRSRPLLREALRSGRVRLRAAQTVLPVAIGSAEATWVELAATLTVRQLEEQVTRAGANPDDADETWFRFRAQLPESERAILDVGLELADEVHPGLSRLDRLEALAQEYLAEFGSEPEGEDGHDVVHGMRPIGRGAELREATLEAETERWSVLPPVGDWPAPDVRFDETETGAEIDPGMQPAGDALPPHRLPVTRRQRRALEPGGRLRLPSPAVHPRRLAARQRPRAGRADVVPARAAVDGAASHGVMAYSGSTSGAPDTRSVRSRGPDGCPGDLGQRPSP